ncbi:hypothetical protein C0991_000866 [Blastosporella zonata]|nr:hypothetical protein C0991_000866 [Blastosporella zonata]
MAPSRKRKRVEHSPEQEEEQVIHNGAKHIKHNPEKEQDVWESFKDEQVEAIDQVPLNLQRQYTLIEDLDHQSNAQSAKLCTILLQYIRTRKDLKSTRTQPVVALELENSVGLPSESPDTNLGEPTERVLSPAPPNPHSPLSKRASTTRELLSRICCMADELLRASEDKVNIVQAACDSVDRHVRILKQAIKDQEALITLGARPGHLEPGNLAELTVGRWVKPTRATLSPINGDEPDEALNGSQEFAASEVLRGLQTTASKKGRGRTKGSRQTSDDVDVVSTPPLTITLPAQPPSQEEEKFCLCHATSYGEMIACDNKKCAIEWFHIGCVGIEEVPPEGMKTWYCPDCRPPFRRGNARPRK